MRCTESLNNESKVCNYYYFICVLCIIVCFADRVWNKDWLHKNKNEGIKRVLSVCIGLPVLYRSVYLYTNNP